MRSMRVSARGLELIKRHEGLRLRAYRCPGGVWTIGYGSTRDVIPGMTITPEQADLRLLCDVADFERTVFTACTRPPNQNQFDAMVSLAFNIGHANFRRSTVLRAHNAGDFSAAARAFNLWNKAGGQELMGLVRRRAEEAALYLEPPVVADVPSIPRTIDPERRETQSQINRAAVGAGTIGTVTLVGEVGRAAGDVRTGLGEYLVPGLLIALIALCVYIIWQRHKQRTGGWA